MSGKRRLLDLFCGAGGCSVGYARAGFEVVGVDLYPQPDYPFRFWQMDALLIEPWVLDAFDVVTASPPCQAFTTLRNMPGYPEHPDLVEPVRAMLTGRTYVIENVVGAPLRAPYLLCGSMFGLDVRRHRLFESTVPLMVPSCQHGVHTPRFSNIGTRRRALLSSVVGVYGGSHFKGDNLKYRSDAMGIDWMPMRDLSQAIPPAYTELIGHQLLQHLDRQAREPEAVSPTRWTETSVG